MAKIIGIGNALVDILVHLHSDQLLDEFSLPKGGMTHIDRKGLMRLRQRLVGLQVERATGGSAANTILALSILGNATGFIGAIGDDETGHFFKERARQRGIDLHLAIIPDEQTGTANALVTPDHERTFATHLGASVQLGKALKEVDLKQFDILHIEGYLLQDRLQLEEILRAAKAAGLVVSYDLASWNIVREHHILITELIHDYVDIAFANEDEAIAFSGLNDPEGSLRLLASMTDTAIVKIGKKGALGMSRATGNEVFMAPGLNRKVVDTTAAGDFFAAGFLHGYIHGKDLATCLDYGNRTASEVIQVMGTQVSDEQLRRVLSD
ncbi:MAG: adenosine kinase [Bacteroidales bacterium]|nr:adenosine kinase [Bacteroidales bacterium]